jgi:spore germination protein YaaH
VNIDIEGYGTVEDPAPRGELTQLVANLSNALRAQNPHAQISMDAVGYPANGFWWTGYDWPKLAQLVDFLVVMMYNLLNVDACSRGNCSLQPRYSIYAQSALPAHAETVKQYKTRGVPPSKLVLGVPWYGYSSESEFALAMQLFCPVSIVSDPSVRTRTADDCGIRMPVAVPCASTDRALPCELPVPWPADPVAPWPCKEQPDPWCCPQQVSYTEVLRLKEDATSGPWQYDAVSVSAFFDARNATGGRSQLWYDDPATLSVKATWMKAVGVRGVAMWTASSVNYTVRGGQDAAAMWAALRLIL